MHTNVDVQSCLELVKLCSSFIGTDSVFKTMSSMNRVPTKCILGDFPDEIRDQYFINQYEKDGKFVPDPEWILTKLLNKTSASGVLFTMYENSLTGL